MQSGAVAENARLFFTAFISSQIFQARFHFESTRARGILESCRKLSGVHSNHRDKQKNHDKRRSKCQLISELRNIFIYKPVKADSRILQDRFRDYRTLVLNRCSAKL